MHPKVKAASAAGSVMILISWIVGLYHVTIPPEVAAAGTTIIASAAGYLKPSRPAPARSKDGRFTSEGSTG